MVLLNDYRPLRLQNILCKIPICLSHKLKLLTARYNVKYVMKFKYFRFIEFGIDLSMTLESCYKRQM